MPGRAEPLRSPVGPVRGADSFRVALVQCPAWGILPPLGPAALKAYLTLHGIESRCFDLNAPYYHEERRARAADRSGAYGGPDPWGAESFDQWGFDDRQSQDSHASIRFQEGSSYNVRPLPIERWAQEILAWDPDVVGFTIYVTSFTTSLLVAEEIKRQRPGVTIVFGGPHVASDQCGGRALRTGVPDVVVDGEGEETLLEIAEAIAAGSTDLSVVAGAGTLVDGHVRWAPKRPLLRKIDDLPYPDFSDFDWSLYTNPYLIPIMSSRGCVLDCAFCYETVYWKRFRTQSPERIVGEIEHQVNQHPLRAQAEVEDERFYFMFADSLVNGHLGGLRRFSELLAVRDLPVAWGGQATINTKMDAAFFTKLKASGCTGLAFGLESGSQRVLESMGKHFHINDAADFIRSADLAGVTVTANIMVGYPNETGRDFIETLRFLARVRKSLYQVSNVTTTQIALGSDLHTRPEHYGVTVHVDGTWTSEETGDDLTRDRRLHMLHLWMRLLRIPHQSIAPTHRRRARRQRRAERKARGRTSPTGLRAGTRRLRSGAGAGADGSTAPGEAVWLNFDDEGSAPRDEPPPWPAKEPAQAHLRVTRSGGVTVESWEVADGLPLDRQVLAEQGLDGLAELVRDTFSQDIHLARPDPEDHEFLWIVGLDTAGDLRLSMAVVPTRGEDGGLEGLRIAIALVAVGQPVAISARPSR